jgi:hypothetical protein
LHSKEDLFTHILLPALDFFWAYITQRGCPKELASWVNVSGAWQRQLRVVATMTTTPRRGYHGGTPIAGWSIIEKPIKHIKMDDLGGAVPFF